MIKAIFFDFDGVLFDTEVFDQELNRKFIDENNLPLPYERMYKLICGDRTTDLWGKILEGYEDQIDKDWFTNHLRAYKMNIRENTNFSFLMFPEVPEILKALKKSGLKIVCASSSPRDYLERRLKEGNIRDYFDLLVSGYDFKQSKPNPEIYNFCLKSLQINPEEAIVVEDSKNGILAGKAAKITVVARKDTHFDIDQSQADGLIDNLYGLMSYLV